VRDGGVCFLVGGPLKECDIFIIEVDM